MADDGTERDRSPRRKDKKSKWGAEEGASLPPPVPKAAGKKSKWGADDVEASPPAAEPKAASMTNADFAASLFDDPSLYQQPGVVPGKNPASGSNFSGAPLKDQASLGDDPNLNPLTGKPYSKRYFGRKNISEKGALPNREHDIQSTTRVFLRVERPFFLERSVQARALLAQEVDVPDYRTIRPNI